ncbi:MAG: hypothetical protein WC358_06835 [Ignavibacteria bacterium]|jgi:hypothetical protein
MEIELPAYLERFIFDTLNGIYKIRWNKTNNLENNEEENKIYIGTYFPRSYAESKIIFNDLFKNNHIKNSFIEKDTISILDIGTGTGGNLIGLMESLKENFGKKALKIFTFEGNINALEFFDKFVKKFKITFNYNNIITNNVSLKISSNSLYVDTFYKIFDFNTKFDVVMSSKFISEFYNETQIGADGVYKDFARISSDNLNKDGIAIVLDTTNKLGNNKYTSYVMTKELKEYIKENEENIKFILPKSCALWYNKCNTGDCFIQRVIQVKHRKDKIDNRKINNISNICYALLSKPSFANEVIESYRNDISYAICVKKGMDLYIDGICRNGIQTKGFTKLNNNHALKLN